MSSAEEFLFYAIGVVLVLAVYGWGQAPKSMKLSPLQTKEPATETETQTTEPQAVSEQITIKADAAIEEQAAEILPVVLPVVAPVDLEAELTAKFTVSKDADPTQSVVEVEAAPVGANHVEPEQVALSSSLAAIEDEATVSASASVSATETQELNNPSPSCSSSKAQQDVQKKGKRGRPRKSNRAIAAASSED